MRTSFRLTPPPPRAKPACRFVALRRPPWTAVAGDRWIEVNDTRAAVERYRAKSRRVFVALGRNELAPFSDAPQHLYLIRSVDPVDPPLSLPHVAYVTARGPFSEADDRALMMAHGIDVVIAKNSGGTAAYGKIAAARALGIEVILLRRPPAPDGPAVETRRRSDCLARSCAHLRGGARRVDERRAPGARDHARLARADDDQCRHVGAASRRLLASVVTLTRSSGRPTARPNTTGVAAGRCRRSRSSALPSCQGRARETGL